MKFPVPSLARRRSAAFMYLENLVAGSILLIVVAGAFMIHIFGIKLYEVARTKLGASDEARAALSLLIDEVRTAKIIKIGNGGLDTFQEIPIDTEQVGNAIQIYPTTNTADFVRYFRDPMDEILKRTTDEETAYSVVAHSVSNEVVFTSEDFAGNILTNNQNNRVIGLALEFYQIMDRQVDIGPEGLYDYYRLRTKITRRALE